MNGLIAKNLKGMTEVFNIHSIANHQKIQEEPFGDIEKFSKKRLIKPKKEDSVSKKVERGTLLLWNGFMLEALDAFKMKY